MKLKIILHEYCNGMSGGTRLYSIEQLEGTKDELAKVLKTMASEGFDLGMIGGSGKLPFYGNQLAAYRFTGKTGGTYEQGISEVCERDLAHIITLTF